MSRKSANEKVGCRMKIAKKLPYFSKDFKQKE